MQILKDMWKGALFLLVVLLIPLQTYAALNSDFVQLEVNYNPTPIMNTSRINPADSTPDNTTLEGFCNATDNNDIDYYYRWYKSGELNSTGQYGTNVSSGTEINVANITSEDTTDGDEWILSCLATDDTSNSSWMNSSITSISSDIWSYYYGNVSATIVLATSTNNSIISWNVTNLNNSFIYITDKESDISWLNLTAIGTDTSGATCCISDFEELDTILSIDTYAENLNYTFTENDAPRQEEDMRLNDRMVYNVHMAELSGTSNFAMGLLWDSTDDASDNNVYDSIDKEDVLMVARMYSNVTCTYGICDFEIRVPSDLSYYNSTTTNTLYLYMDIN